MHLSNVLHSMVKFVGFILSYQCGMNLYLNYFGGMRSRIVQFVIIIFIHIWITRAHNSDHAALEALKDAWQDSRLNWIDGTEPCDGTWVGIICTDDRVTSISLASMELTGGLPDDIEHLTELETLNLSYNKGLNGSLTSAIGNLGSLRNLILVDCGFSGPIPDEIGNLQMLQYLSLNLNGFSGTIPASIGKLEKLKWLDLSQNKLNGSIPISNGTKPGLDMLSSLNHFDLGDNQLSGDIPPQLFSSSNTQLIHLLFENNQFTGSIPSTFGVVPSLKVIRLDRNLLKGDVPSNIQNLVQVNVMYLSNNQLTGPVPNITNMKLLKYLDLSNNRLNGTLDIIPNPSNQLQLVDLRSNQIAGFTQQHQYTIGLLLVDNPICMKLGVRAKYCSAHVNTEASYSTPTKNSCILPSCGSGQVSSPNCICAHPYKGFFFIKAPFFSDLKNTTIYNTLHDSMMNFFQEAGLPVDSVSLNNPRRNPRDYLVINLEVFPYGAPYFNWTTIDGIGYAFSSQTFKPQNIDTYVFDAESYNILSDHKSSNTGVIIGSAVGGCVLVILLVLAIIYAIRRKGLATKRSSPFALWDPTSGSGGVPELKETRSFTFEELKKYTNNFSESNKIGAGGYGMVYRGSLPNGELIAIKRAQQGSSQGGLEFKTEIELLSRVHHKNVVGLVGFCFDHGEQMLVYEYIVNGTLKDSLSGRSGIRLDWMRRLTIAFGAGQGLQYLHDLANPPIIHRDIKTNNILLDARLVAKVADFGLSRPLSDANRTHVTTQVKGTMGYMDPEYYMTQQLTEKSDVYSFGVVMLELITARNPIEKGKYIVREVKETMNKSKELYGLYEILDPTIGLSSQLKGLERFVDLSLRCVEETGNQRPTMSEVVKELESIMELAGLNPGTESSSSTSTSYERTGYDYNHPYSNDSLFSSSGGFPPPKLQPK